MRIVLLILSIVLFCVVLANADPAARSNEYCNDFQMKLNCALLQDLPALLDLADDTMQQQHGEQGQMNMSGMQMEHHMVHPFFSHMGIPEAPGEFSLRFSGIITRKDVEEGGTSASEEMSPAQQTEGDFAFHLETGLTKWLGFHVRDDRVRQEEHTEVMFQFAAFRSKDGMSGFSPEASIEIPLHANEEGDKTWRGTFGFTASLSRKMVALNEYVDYNPKDKEIENNSALVVHVGKRLYPVFEYLVEKEKGEPAVGSIVAGVKFQLTDLVTLGFAYQHAVTDAREFNWQAIGQSEFHWMR